MTDEEKKAAAEKKAAEDAAAAAAAAAEKAKGDPAELEKLKKAAAKVADQIEGLSESTGHALLEQLKLLNDRISKLEAKPAIIKRGLFF